VKRSQASAQGLTASQKGDKTMRSTNLAILTGNLGDAPQTGQKGDTYWASFSLATNYEYTTDDGTKHTETDWHRVVAFNGLAQTLTQLGKGDRVLVQGRIKTGKYEDQDGIERASFQILATRVEFIRLKDRPERDETPELPEDLPE